MTTVSARALPVLLSICLGCSSVSGDEQSGHWFYMVKSKPTDEAREEAFNSWYDDIDIHDVLAVPGFDRAQRAVGLQLEGFPEVDLEAREGKYVALYDIASADIDKSIIDLYVAARKMSAFGRSTDLLKVVEANYYQRLLDIAGSTSTLSGSETYFYLQKVLCCDDADSREKLLNWLQSSYLPAFSATSAHAGSRLYELYRVMEDWALPDEERPHFLLVHEVTAVSGEDAVREIRRTQRMLTDVDRFIDGDITLYRRMSDVKSN